MPFWNVPYQIVCEHQLSFFFFPCHFGVALSLHRIYLVPGYEVTALFCTVNPPGAHLYVPWWLLTASVWLTEVLRGEKSRFLDSSASRR